MFKLDGGDTVKIENNLVVSTQYDIVDDMLNYKGKLCVILGRCSKSGNEGYYLLEDKKCWVWTLDMFEYIQPQTLTIDMASDPDVVVNCRTKKEAEYFCKWLDLHDKRWCDGARYTEKSNWNDYKQDTCYRVSVDSFANTNHYKSKTIIRFKPSMIQNDPIWNTAKTAKATASNSEKTDKNRDMFRQDCFLKGIKSMTHYSNEDAKNVPLISTLEITNIKFNDKKTIVTINQENIKVTCQNGDIYSKEQAITQAIAKYCGYGTKKINELIERFDVEKKEFKPYLRGIYTGKQRYGDVGKETNLYDVVGRKLKIGDTVEIWRDGVIYNREQPIVEKDGVFFIRGYFNCSFKNGVYDFCDGTSCKAILKRGFSEINDGEVMDDIKYVKSLLKHEFNQ